MQTAEVNYTTVEKKFYFLRLVPCRPDFAQTMSENEQTIMQMHGRYWREKADQGIMLVFGPVFDPAGTYGIGILRVDSEEQMKALVAADPALTSGLHKTVETFPMRAVVGKLDV